MTIESPTTPEPEESYVKTYHQDDMSGNVYVTWHDGEMTLLKRDNPDDARFIMNLKALHARGYATPKVGVSVRKAV